MLSLLQYKNKMFLLLWTTISSVLVWLLGFSSVYDCRQWYSPVVLRTSTGMPLLVSLHLLCKCPDFYDSFLAGLIGDSDLGYQCRFLQRSPIKLTTTARPALWGMGFIYTDFVWSIDDCCTQCRSTQPGILKLSVLLWTLWPIMIVMNTRSFSYDFEVLYFSTFIFNFSPFSEIWLSMFIFPVYSLKLLIFFRVPNLFILIWDFNVLLFPVCIDHFCWIWFYISFASLPNVEYGIFHRSLIY